MIALVLLAGLLDVSAPAATRATGPALTIAAR